MAGPAASRPWGQAGAAHRPVTGKGPQLRECWFRLCSPPDAWTSVGFGHVVNSFLNFPLACFPLPLRAGLDFSKGQVSEKTGKDIKDMPVYPFLSSLPDVWPHFLFLFLCVVHVYHVYMSVNTCSHTYV